MTNITFLSYVFENIHQFFYPLKFIIVYNVIYCSDVIKASLTIEGQQWNLSFYLIGRLISM